MNKKNNQKSKKVKSFLLLELLENFTAAELEGLERIVNCTYFNTDKYVIKLFNALQQIIRKKSSLNEEKILKIYDKVFEDARTKKTLNPQQQTTLRAKMSALMRLAERFLMIEALAENDDSQTELLQKKLLEKKQFRLFNRDINKRRKQLNGQLKDLEYYTHLYKIESGKLDYLYRSGKWIKEDNLPELMESLDIYYLLNRLSLHLTALSFQDISAAKSYDFYVIDTLKALADLRQYAHHPLIQIYRTIIDLMETKSHDIYLQLIDLLDSHEDLISADNLNDFYTAATNFCVHKVKTGDFNYYRHIFDLYRIMDNKNLLLENNIMPAGKLKNMVSTGCRVREFDWAAELIDKYYTFLRKDIRGAARNYNLGLIAFHKKEYQQALDYLYTLDNIDFNHDLNRRIMIVKSHYEIETEYKETTAQVFRSVEKYVQGNKLITVKNRTAYKNFIRLLINLYRVRHSEGKMTLESIKNKLEKSEFISDKIWLLEKIKELENKVVL